MTPDEMVLEDLARENLLLREQNTALRFALADLGADFVLLRMTFLRLLRALDTQNHRLREALEEYEREAAA